MRCEFDDKQLEDACRARVPNGLPADLARALMRKFDVLLAAPTHATLERLHSLALRPASDGRHAIPLDDHHELTVELQNDGQHDLLKICQIAARGTGGAIRGAE